MSQAKKPANDVSRLAVWSGPRNISTALMRSWENRPDVIVVDEPLYAAFLDRTGIEHPGREEVLEVGETDPKRVVDSLLGSVPDGTRVYYQKHMAHHLLPEFDGDWVGLLTNVLLIRDPREVVASYVKSRPEVTPDDIGLPQQARLYERLAARGTAPPVIDSADFLRDPEAHLRLLCGLAGVEFDPCMLSWPPGPRASDGIWGHYWYEGVWASTGFAPYCPRDVSLDAESAAVADACRPLYEWLHSVRVVL